MGAILRPVSERGQAQPELQCPNCRAHSPTLEPRARGAAWACAHCTSQYNFFVCAGCAAVNAVGYVLPRSQPWDCVRCSVANRRADAATVEEAVIDLQRRGPLPPLSKPAAGANAASPGLGACVLVGGGGGPIPVGTQLTVCLDSEFIGFATASGTFERARSEVLDVEIAGPALGWLSAEASAVVDLQILARIPAGLPASLIALRFPEGMQVLHAAGIDPARASGVLCRFPRATRPVPQAPTGPVAVSAAVPVGAQAGAEDPLARLERLARLRDAGALTDEEFELARAPLVRALNSAQP